LLACALACACAGPRDAPERGIDAPSAANAAAARSAIARIDARADSIDDLLLPVPLLTPVEEAELRRFGNAEHVSRARALGVAPGDSAGLAGHQAVGRLVRLADSTDHWVIRELQHSLPLVTPAARAMLERVGARFHERLARMSLPPFRLEITSVLRTSELQRGLRATNPNAAAASSHEFGTTLDVAYASFAAPVQRRSAGEADIPADIVPLVDRLEVAVLEQVAARRSRELQAILGHALRELQAEGVLLVILERQQPVYHLTVARKLSPAS
jgi:hypothetical protein